MPTTSVEPAIRAAAEHTLELLPELDFLQVDGVLTVEVPAPITGVRLDLRTGDPLDLQGLTLVGLERQPDRPAIEVSEWRHGRRVDASTILQTTPADKPALLTPSAEHCWAEITWADPVSPEAILMRQATPMHSHRGSGMVVSVREEASGDWRVLHDGAARIASARDQVLERAATSMDGLLDHEHGVSLVRVMFAAAIGDYPGARAVLSSLAKGGIADDQIAAMKAVVNPMFLARRQRELTVHGATRTFRFWSEAEKVGYLQQAVELCKDLESLSTRVCFGFGAALAVVRDRDLIPHDDDLDLIIALGSDVAQSLPQALSVLESHLRDAGYQVAGGDAFAHRKAGRQGHKKIDVFVGIFDEPSRWRRAARRDKAEISWYPGPRGSLTVGEVFPVSTREILGVAVPMPRDPEHYLQTQYGEGWRVPNPQFRHEWGRGRYKDIARTTPPHS